MPDDIVGDALSVVGLNLVGFERGLPSGFVPDGPFLADYAWLSGKVGAYLSARRSIQR